MQKMDQKKKNMLLAGLLVLLYAALMLLTATGVFSRYVYGIIIICGIYIIVTVSLNLTAGFLGNLVLGQAGFMAAGAFAAGVCTLRMGPPVSIQIPVSLLIGELIAGACGFLVCIPTLKVRGGYLAMVTLGFGEIMLSLLVNMDITGGALGLTGIARFPSRPLALTYVFVLAAVTVLVIWRLVHSEYGRAICSIRDNEMAAQSVGIPIKKLKLLTYTVSAFFAGIGGGLYVHYMGNAYSNKFTMAESFELLVIVVLGGLGNIKGTILCAIVLKVLPEVLRGVAEYRTLMYGVVLVFFMLLTQTGAMDEIRKRFNKSGLHISGKEM